MGGEPVVLAEDVSRVLRAAVLPQSAEEGEAVAMLAERADTSARTVYRVLRAAPREDGTPAVVSLDLADRLVLAAGRSLAEVGCRLVLSDGRVVSYEDA